MKRKWKTLDGKAIDDFPAFIVGATRQGQILHIGTDSLQTGRYTQFVSVVVILNPPKGGRVAYTREVVPRITSLRQRLWDEAWRSLQIAMQVPDNVDTTIHIDANAQQRYMSSKYLQELVGLVVGQGFKALWKPDSWAASTVADHIVRTKGKLPRPETQPVLKTGVA